MKKYWGFTSFKGSQEKIINTVLNKTDVLALLPTGGGKSLCYQIPALAQDGICIVVSPLVALIHNQVETLKEKGIKAIALTGGIPFDEVSNLLDNCIHGNYKFLYLSPERLQQEVVSDRIRQMNVNLIAIDEAHCISQWGHDFRPAYLECSRLKELAPDISIIALTATATEKVAKDILENLGMHNKSIIKDSFLRDNIAFTISWDEDKLYRLQHLCTTRKDSTIVYVRTRRLCVELSSFLQSKGCSVSFFHGGMPKKEKEKRLNAWLKNKTQIMVATNAFGMGVDKPDVKLVVHYQIPDSLENYFQEAGRAGRNGEAAQAVLITNKADEEQVKKQFLSVLPDVSFLKLLYRKLNSYFQIPYGEGANETFALKFNEFCNIYELNTLLAYNGLRMLDQNSIIGLSENFSKKTTVQFICTKQQLFAYLEIHKKEAPILKTILRTYGGIFDYNTKINTYLISKKANVTEDNVIKTLERLKTDEIITYNAQHSDLEVTFLVPREDDNTIHGISKKVETIQKVKSDNITHMLSYIKNDTVCRSKQLLQYFGERLEHDCGICDICLHKDEIDIPIINLVREDILKRLSAGNMSSRELIQVLTYKEKNILLAIQELLEDELIKIDLKNKYELI
ncbi:RecQ family ATP-dependent DNA helicase [Costertonia aggregata]|uniref:RecQ family ATP-dependent DNA helicase n=1 Tax=Costertonia aggregata TaxID=343403 RepID=UPI0021D17AD4|nr:RecQ family ATP-dependent DNA helicase [Costertonia aggregata]